MMARQQILNVAGVSVPHPRHWRPHYLTLALVLLIVAFVFQAITGKLVWKGLGK